MAGPTAMGFNLKFKRRDNLWTSIHRDGVEGPCRYLQHITLSLPLVKAKGKYSGHADWSTHVMSCAVHWRSLGRCMVSKDGITFGPQKGGSGTYTTVGMHVLRGGLVKAKGMQTGQRMPCGCHVMRSTLDCRIGWKMYGTNPLHPPYLNIVA